MSGNHGGGGIRRKMEGYAPVSRDFIRILVDKVDGIDYGNSMIRDLSPEEQKLRNKALISILYLGARRISEIVGRSYKGDIYEGIKLTDFSFTTLEGREVMFIRCRILKKWRRKEDKPKLFEADVILDMKDAPFISHILAWLDHQKEKGEEKYMVINRSRAYQILHQIDSRIVGPHWFRHMRLTHLAEHLNPYQLKQRIGFWESIDPAVAYVHGRVGDYLEAVEYARGEAIEQKVEDRKVEYPSPRIVEEKPEPKRVEVVRAPLPEPREEKVEIKEETTKEISTPTTPVQVKEKEVILTASVPVKKKGTMCVHEVEVGKCEFKDHGEGGKCGKVVRRTCKDFVYEER
jgi:hypothetical protein